LARVEKEVAEMEVQIGRVTHYYNKIAVAVFVTGDDLKVGDRIHILGYNTDFTQTVTSMEIEHQQIKEVSAGTEVALKVRDEVRRGDHIYKLEED
jgi:translation elongation factor EF-Tu-like GTPase